MDMCVISFIFPLCAIFLVIHLMMWAKAHSSLFLFLNAVVIAILSHYYLHRDTHKHVILNATGDFVVYEASLGCLSLT